MGIYRFFKKLISLPFIGLIIFYQYSISPFIVQRCRFYPSCSCYAKEAFKKHDFVYATYLTFKRLAKCHPLSRRHGVDFVPEKNQRKKG